MLCNKNMCTGCLACADICPKNAIKVYNDEKGFWNVSVDASVCVKCGLCEKVCPQMCRKQIYENNVILDTYVLKHKNAEILARSTSGGAFSALTDIILEKNGVVYGAVYDENLGCCHARASTKIERDKMCGSKYQQSDMKGIYNLILDDLKKNRYVLFSGTPCQVDSIQRYLMLKNIDTTKLFTVDFVCHGVPSPQLFKEYVRYRLPDERNIQVLCRDKQKSWRHPYFHVIGRQKHWCTISYIDPYMNLFFENTILRESCYNCKYADCHRVSDITLADCWDVHRVCPQMDDDKGVSNIFISTYKGQKLCEKINNRVVLQKVNLKDCMQQPLSNPPHKSSYSDRFWASYKEEGLKYSLEHYSVISKKDIIWYKYIIPCLKKMKLYNIMRRMLG